MKQPDRISKDRMCKILHISKRKAQWMLENGIIPCEKKNTATHKYSIAMEDIRAYQKRSPVEKRKEIPVGIFNASAVVCEICPELYLKLRGAERSRFAALLAEEFEKSPDDLKINDAAELIGYDRSSILYHVQHGHIKGIFVAGIWHIPKNRLVTYLTTDRAMGIRHKSEWHRNMIRKYISDKEKRT